jgi:hypothetical protein
VAVAPNAQVPAFFARSAALQQEMKWQRKLTSAAFFHWVTVRMTTWQYIGLVGAAAAAVSFANPQLLTFG